MNLILKYFKILFYRNKVIYFAAFLFCLNCFGQSITWQRTYDGRDHLADGSYGICKDDENNFFVTGLTTVLPNNTKLYVLKLNQLGDTLWTKIIDITNSNQSEARAVTSSDDGGCVITGSANGSFTLKLDRDGKTIWNRNYGGGLKQCFSIIKTSDGGYIACGRDADCSTDCAYILKVDSLGNLQWQNTFPAGYWKNFECITETNDLSGYITVGFNMNFSSDTPKAYITKINYSGDLIWDKQFLIHGNTAIRKIIKFKDHYIIAGGTVSHLDNFTKLFFGKLDEFGDTSKIKVFESNLNEYYGDFDIINENKFIFSSSIDSINFLDGHIFTFDSLGNIISDKTYHSKDVMHLDYIMPLENSDIIIGGNVDFDPVHTRDDIYILRTDSLLNAPPPIGIINHNINLPANFKLYPNVPNPFNPVTLIKYDIYKNTNIELSIYNINGQKIKILDNEYKNAGKYRYELNTNNLNLASGIYFIKLENDQNIKQSIKIVLLK